MKTAKSIVWCAHCGEGFHTLVGDGVIATHNFPNPGRSICPVSNEKPRKKPDTPLWKDEPEQQVRDFLEQAGTEL